MDEAVLDEVYEFLTVNTRFRVVDIETTTYNKKLRIVSVAVVEVNDGQLGQTQSWMVNPGVPIDARSYSIHGISDEQVKDCPSFYEVSEQVKEALCSLPEDDPGTIVWVAHKASFDVRVLAHEFEQSVTLVGNFPVLDTMAMPRHLGDETIVGAALPAMAAFYGVKGLEHHRAESDAQATAKILIKQLRRACETGATDLKGLLTTCKARMSSEVKPDAHAPESLLTQSNAVPQTHVDAHLPVLPAGSDAKTRRKWAQGFAVCASLGCRYGADHAEAVIDSGSLLTVVTKQGKRVLSPSSVGVNMWLCALEEAVAVIGRAGALTWWLNVRNDLSPVSCPPGAAVKCLRCLSGRACAADAFYQQIARIMVGTTSSGSTPKRTVAMLTGKTGGVEGWVARGAADVSGFALWLGLEYCAAVGDKTGAGKLRALSARFNLSLLEPRLALDEAVRMLAAGNRGGAQLLVETTLAARSTDTGFGQLEEFRLNHLQPKPIPVETVPPEKRRYGTAVRRPADRKETLRFKIS